MASSKDNLKMLMKKEYIKDGVDKLSMRSNNN